MFVVVAIQSCDIFSLPLQTEEALAQANVDGRALAEEKQKLCEQLTETYYTVEEQRAKYQAFEKEATDKVICLQDYTTCICVCTLEDMSSHK